MFEFQMIFDLIYRRADSISNFCDLFIRIIYNFFDSGVGDSDLAKPVSQQVTLA